MVKKAAKFTPEVLLSSPRRSTGQASPCGKYVLHTLSTYDFKEHKKVSEIRVLEHEKALSHLIVGEGKGSEAVWLPGNYILYLKQEAGDTGRTELIQTTLKGKDVGFLGVTDGEIHGLKAKVMGNGEVLLLAWGRADRDGNLVNEKKKQKAPPHTSRLYDSLMVRHWDTWKDKNHNALFFAHMMSTVDEVGEKAWALTKWTNILKGTRLESPIAPFPSSDQYDISERGIVFIAKDPELDAALHTKSDSYFVPIIVCNEGRCEVPDLKPRKIEVPELEGAASSPVFSTDGKSLAFLKMREDGAESDRNHVILATMVDDAEIVSEPVLTYNVAEAGWDISPAKVIFGHNPGTLFLLAEYHGINKLWLLESKIGLCEPLTRHGSLSDVQRLQNPPRLFLSGSSLVDDSLYSMLWPDEPKAPEILSSHSRNGSLYGLSPSQSTSFYYDGHRQMVHSLQMLPSDFDPDDKSKKWPLALLVHGGPQGAWLDSWSTRWNPAVWAEQGYVVVMPNITGSTGYGQDFVDAITGDWGGAPYEDLVKLMDHIRDQMPYIDLDRAIAAGASYGGYMMNWIQGQDLGRKFKALVCHDGSFDNAGAQFSTDELYFLAHDMGGAPWVKGSEGDKGAEIMRKYNPSRFVQNWATPQLVIHNEKDFRLSVAEGLSAFNVLQAKKIPSRLLVGKDENHWTLNEENSLVWHTVVLNWANKYVNLPLYKEDEKSIIDPDEPFPEADAE